MIIEYCNSKEVKCYRDFVQNPSDRKALRAFSKTFGDALMEPAVPFVPFPISLVIGCPKKGKATLTGKGTLLIKKTE